MKAKSMPALLDQLRARLIRQARARHALYLVLSEWTLLRSSRQRKNACNDGDYKNQCEPMPHRHLIEANTGERHRRYNKREGKASRV